MADKPLDPPKINSGVDPDPLGLIPQPHRAWINQSGGTHGLDFTDFMVNGHRYMSLQNLKIMEEIMIYKIARGE